MLLHTLWYPTATLEWYCKQVSLEPDVVITENSKKKPKNSIFKQGASGYLKSSLGSYLNIDQFEKGLCSVDQNRNTEEEYDHSTELYYNEQLKKQNKVYY